MHTLRRTLYGYGWTMITVLLTASTGWAATIRLHDQTTVTGDILRLEDERVVISLPRASVSTVDGQALPAPVMEGMPAPEFTVTDIAGRPQAVTRNTKAVTVLHFWVHWCPHCRSDAPKIQALYDQYRQDSRVHLITVNLDNERKDVDQFLVAHHVTYPVIFAIEQAQRPKGTNVPDLYQVSAFPITYLIDTQGIIRHKFVGSFTESGTDLTKLVSDLLKSPAPAASYQPKASDRARKVQLSRD